MTTQQQLDILADIFGHTERPDKVTVRLDQVARTLTVVYEDLDEEWFQELVEAARISGGEAD